MSRPKGEPKSDKASWPLPAPAALLRHHARTLEGPLGRWREEGRVPPVLLLTGPPGVGKRTLAYTVAQWLLCPISGPGPSAADSTTELFSAPPKREPSHFPCGKCPACQKALSGNWVDFDEISTDGDEETGGNLGVDRFRRLKESLGFGAYDGGYRVTLIRDADRMTVQAANSLLKLLEEPPPGRVFLLTAGDPTLLLPTLISRCQRLRLQPLPRETILELLEATSMPAERRAACAALAGGSWGKALALSEPETWEKRAAILRFLERPAAELGALVDWASGSEGALGLLIDQLELLVSDLVRQGSSLSHSPAGRRAWLNADGAAALEAQSESAKRHFGSPEAARDFWLERGERLLRARAQAQAPLNRKLLVQDLLLPWLEVGTR